MSPFYLYIVETMIIQTFTVWKTFFLFLSVWVWIIGGN